MNENDVMAVKRPNMCECMNKARETLIKTQKMLSMLEDVLCGMESERSDRREVGCMRDDAENIMDLTVNIENRVERILRVVNG